MNKVYAGVSAFFANRTKPNRNHNWLDNVKRPFISLVKTARDGTKSYNDLFLNTDAVEVSQTKTHVVIKIPKDINKPLFRILDKDE